MTERRGYAIMIGGDTEIARALAAGMKKGRHRLETPEEAEARRRARRYLDNMKLHGERTARYWSELMVEADLAYGEPLEPPTLWERAVKAVAQGWGVLWCMILMIGGRF